MTALHPLTGRPMQKQIDLARGAHADVDFQLTISGLRLGLAGIVLDEDGFPLPEVGVRLQVPDEEPVDLTTDLRGTFELWSRPAQASRSASAGDSSTTASSPRT